MEVATAGYGDGRIYRQATSKNWWMEYWVDGVQYRESSGSPDQKTAEAFLKHRITEKSAHHAGLTTFVGPQNTPITYLLDMLLDDYRIRGASIPGRDTVSPGVCEAASRGSERSER